MQAEAMKQLARTCPLVALAISRPKDHAVLIVPLDGGITRQGEVGGVRPGHAKAGRLPSPCSRETSPRVPVAEKSEVL